MTDTPWDQRRFAVRLEWGEQGLAGLLPAADAVVIVDVLSFCTVVDASVERGVAVHPVARYDAEAEALAARTGAVLAGRREAGGRRRRPARCSSCGPEAGWCWPRPTARGCR